MTANWLQIEKHLSRWLKERLIISPHPMTYDETRNSLLSPLIKYSWLPLGVDYLQIQIRIIQTTCMRNSVRFSVRKGNFSATRKHKHMNPSKSKLRQGHLIYQISSITQKETRILAQKMSSTTLMFSYYLFIGHACCRVPTSRVPCFGPHVNPLFGSKTIW